MSIQREVPSRGERASVSNREACHPPRNLSDPFPAPGRPDRRASFAFPRTRVGGEVLAV